MVSVENVAVSGRPWDLTLVPGWLAKGDGMMSYLALCFIVESMLGEPSGGNTGAFCGWRTIRVIC